MWRQRQPWELEHGVQSMIWSEVLQEGPQTLFIPHPHLFLTHQRPRNRLGTGELRFGVPLCQALDELLLVPPMERSLCGPLKPRSRY